MAVFEAWWDKTPPEQTREVNGRLPRLPGAGQSARLVPGRRRSMRNCSTPPATGLAQATDPLTAQVSRRKSVSHKKVALPWPSETLISMG